MEAAELYYKPWTYFWTVQSLGLFLLLAGVIYKFKFYFKAKRKSLYKKISYWLMLKAFFREVLFQRQLAAKGAVRWAAHLMIFYGFIGLLMLSAIAVALETVIPESSTLGRFMLEGQGRNYYKAAGDFFGLIILVGLITPFLRRFILKDKQLDTDSSDTMAISSLFLLVITGFLLEAVRIAMVGMGPEVQYSFVANALAVLFRGSEGIQSRGIV